MKEVNKVKISDNPNSQFDTLLILLDNDDKELLKMNIERITGDLMQTELNSYSKYKKSIWDVCGDLLKPRTVGGYVIEKEVNKEYFGYFTLEDDEKLYMRPSDGIIIAFSWDMPVYLSNDLYTTDEKEEISVEDIEKQIKEALAAENYGEAARLKKIKDAK